ncbi:MAG: hypothetical protein K8S27_00615 [Candidatus Omnitrophica bacterium]|nr:hypothetical protein [Candidatus Omnitrophota bacterium]
MKKQVLAILTAVIVMLTLSLSVAAGPRLTSGDLDDFMSKSDIQPSDNAAIKDVGFQDYIGKSDTQPSDNAAIKNVGFEDYMGKSDIQPSANAAIKNVGFQDFISQSGIQPSNVQALELGTPTLGIVKDAAQLSKLGIKGTKVGDIVLLTLLDDGTLKISVIDVKQEKVIQLEK